MKTDLNVQKNIDTPFLRIRDNCLEIQNTTIQLSNISLFSTADLTPDKFPLLSILFILGGVILFKYFAVPSILAVLIGGIWIYFWFGKLQETKYMKRLTIITNSGNIFPILFNDKDFLDQVVVIMTDIIRDPAHARNITINVKECKFFDDSSVL